MSQEEKKHKRRHLKRKALVWARNLGSVLLVAYLVVAIALASRAHDEQARCTGLRVTVLDSNAEGFVTAREIARELGALPRQAKGMLLSDINSEEILRRLDKVDKIESASVVKTSDGLLSVAVTPLTPALRVFDGDRSYYVNRAGKRIRATARYHIDVPVVYGSFPPSDTLFTPQSLLPLIDYIQADPTLSRLVTAIQAYSPEDIYIIPALKGHVVCLGSIDALPDKFSRLSRMYREVLPVKGWDFYDTISVKWGKQIVATRRIKPRTLTNLTVGDEDDDADLTTMLAGEGVAPGRALPGQKALSEKPIPAAKPMAAPSDSAKKSTDKKAPEKKK